MHTTDTLSSTDLRRSVTRRVRTQRMGGFAALAAAGTFVVGIAMFVTSLSDYTDGDPTPGESVAFLVANQTALRIWYVVTLIVFGLALVPLVLAIADRLSERTPTAARASTAFGLIWAGLVLAGGMVANIGIGAVADLVETNPANAESVWSSLDTVVNGLTGGNEVTGGVWVLVLSAAALSSGVLPRALSAVGVVSGAAGLVTIAPGMEAFEMVFGLGVILWFVGVGISLLRHPEIHTDRARSTSADSPPGHPVAAHR